MGPDACFDLGTVSATILGKSMMNGEKQRRVGLGHFGGACGAVACAFAAVFLYAAPGAAQTQESKADDGSYGYEFEDDPLNAGGFGPNDATIRVRANAARTTLIRPRTSFVPEMLKSVEDL